MSSAKSFHNRVLYKIPNNLLAIICHYFTNIYQTCPQLYTGLCDNVHEQCVSAHWNKLTATNIYNHCELKTILVLLWAQFTEMVTWNLIYGPLERNDACMWKKKIRMWPECVLSFILACMPDDSYCKQFRPLLLCPLFNGDANRVLSTCLLW